MLLDTDYVFLLCSFVMLLSLDRSSPQMVKQMQPSAMLCDDDIAFLNLNLRLANE